ncbi:superfamily II DNA or RNA helicase [Desulfitispora alkaliphila]|uniref:DEAD/DEAH box helicase n=1 Tax=Desulfitispora alkaliphila TaxID=622674 RepID=UPI003D206FC4
MKLNIEWIKGQCENQGVFSRGIKYLQQGLVRKLTFDHEEKSYNAWVSGTYEYHVQVVFYGHNSWDFFCTCPVYDQRQEVCKHVVAVLLMLYRDQKQIRFNNTGTVNQQETEQIQQQRLREKMTSTISEMLGLVHYPLEPGEAKTTGSMLKVEPTLKVSYQEWDRSWEYLLSLKIGLDRLYVVKSIDDFLRARYEEGSLYFGKKFTYYDNEHYFSEVDQELIDFLEELDELERSLQSGFASYPYERRVSLISGKYARIPSSMVANVLTIFKKRDFTLELKGVSYHIEKIQQSLPLSMELLKERELLQLKVNLKGDVISLEPNSRFLYYNKQVFHISQEEKQTLLPIFVGLKEMNPILVPPEYQEKFISQIYPLLPQVGELKVAPVVTDNLLQEPLVIKMYLDEMGKKLTAKVEFCYGGRIIDPFGAENGVKSTEKILVRDSQRESQFMNQLERANFKVEQSGLYLEEEGKIYVFLTEKIPALQKLAQIFYSDRLKNLGVSRPKVKGRLGLSSRGDLLELGFEWEGIDQRELAGLFKALREKRRYFRLKGGGFFSLDQEQDLQELAELMDELSIKDKDLQKKVIHLPKYRAFNLEQVTQGSLASSFQREAAFQELLDKVKNPAKESIFIPEPMDSVMREYQKQGFRWLKTLANCGFGGVLADDMGLGKTLQAIALIASELQDKGGVALVVAPTSVVYNWQAELAKFAPELKTQLVTGTPGERQELLATWPQLEAQVLITSYATLRRDEKLYQNKTLSLLILDEAQYIKNGQSQTAMVAKSISAGQVFALTGTPVENSLAELWSIFDCVLPGYLYSLKVFNTRYGKPIQQDGDQQAAATLAQRVSPFILRRLKKDVLKELPEKIEDKLLSSLTIEQQKVYLAYWNQFRGEMLQELEEQGFEKSKLKILAGIMRLRQICCHPSLFLDNYHGGSGKLEQLEQVVMDSVESGHRVLIFSQFTGMLELIGQMLTKGKLSYYYLDGATPASKRLEMANAFNAGERKLFLVSLKAGGTGLNLIGADKVIHYDLWWNPAVEDQASDRAHRLGQKQVVHVTRMISMGTIEEKIFALQQQKRELIDQVIKPEEKLLTSLSEEEIRQLLEL